MRIRCVDRCSLVLFQERTLLMVARAPGRCTFTATSCPVDSSRARNTCAHKQIVH